METLDKLILHCRARGRPSPSDLPAEGPAVNRRRAQQIKSIKLISAPAAGTEIE
jgi:hypothetical protein